VSAAPARIEVLPDAEALAAAAAERLLAWTAELAHAAPEGASAQAGPGAARRVSVALAGGRTPRRCYELLAAAVRAGRASLRDWDVFLGDERVVPPDDAASNGRMAAEALVDGGALAPAQLHRMVDRWPLDAEAAAARYAALLPARLDILLLGMGPDGHTASLFPGSPALEERERRVVVAEASVAPRQRLTLTPPALAAARRVLVLVSGADKAEAAARALQGPPDVRGTPAQLLRSALWMLDPAAGAQLRAG